jgi:DNA mismatch repair protein MutS
MNILDDYLQYHDVYSKKYGHDSTVILMQVGSFYEMYALLDRGPNLEKITEHADITLTRKDKSCFTVDKSNPKMAGFPVASALEHINKLIAVGYTLVVIDQVGTKMVNHTGKYGKLKEIVDRQVTNIYSPGIYIENINVVNTNYIACIYLDLAPQPKARSVLCAGLSAIDVTTGKVIIHESIPVINASGECDEKLSLDESVRFINAINPKEIIIMFFGDDNKKLDFFLQYMEIDNKNTRCIKTVDAKYLKLSYQNEFLRNVYPDVKTILTPIEYLDLEKSKHVVVSLVYLLDYIYDHNEKFIKSLYKPDFFLDNKHLVLGNNAIYQLNVLESDQYKYYSNTKFKCLYDILNEASTPMGKRYVRARLLSPMVNKEDINKNYEYIDTILKNNILNDIEKHLTCIHDVERLNRKIGLGVLHPTEMGVIIDSYKNIIALVKYLEKSKLKELVCNEEYISSLSEFIEEVDKHL